MGLKAEDMYAPYEYKGRTFTLPLSDDDRKYLLTRGKDPVVAELDRQWENVQFRIDRLKETGEWDDDDTETEVEEEDAPPYEEWNKNELIAEIDERNKGREPEFVMSNKGNKEELSTRLYADDERLDAQQ